MTKRPHQKVARRKAARIAAVQALYQIELMSGDPLQVVAEFKTHRLDALFEPLGLVSPDVDGPHFDSIVSGVMAAEGELDPEISQNLEAGWSLNRCGFLLRACLRAAAFELIHRTDIPPKVAISEYVQIAQMFTGRGQGGFINAVLDKIARRHRAELF